MGFNQRSTVTNLITTILVFGWYFFTAFGAHSAGKISVTEFGPRMWWTMLAYVVLIIASMILAAIFSRDEGDEMGEFDERDKQIDRLAETISGYVVGTGLLGALYLVMQEPSTFVIAHALLALMVIQAATSFAARLYLYAR